MTSCLLDYNYFNKFYKITAIDLSKQRTLDADPKAGNCQSFVNLIYFNIISV